MAWTDERIDHMKAMWEKGMTASQIADELGGVSRNAVIGKAHRLGLQSRPSPVKPNEPDAAKAAAPEPKPAPAPAARKPKRARRGKARRARAEAGPCPGRESTRARAGARAGRRRADRR